MQPNPGDSHAPARPDSEVPRVPARAFLTRVIPSAAPVRVVTVPEVDVLDVRDAREVRDREPVCALALGPGAVPDGGLDAGLDGGVDPALDPVLDAELDAEFEASLDAELEADLEAELEAEFEARQEEAAGGCSALAVPPPARTPAGLPVAPPAGPAVRPLDAPGGYGLPRQGRGFPAEERASTRGLRVGRVPEPVRAAGGTRGKGARTTEFVEPRGCLYALSQPPLMLFLCVIGGLIGGGAAWDLLFL